VRRVVSERAERWIGGELGSASYFAYARRESVLLARAEVVARLQRNPRAPLSS
jgi:hypothetical protein